MRLKQSVTTPQRKISRASPELEDLLFRISITLFWSYDDDDDDAFLCKNTPITWRQSTDNLDAYESSTSINTPLPTKFYFEFLFVYILSRDRSYFLDYMTAISNIVRRIITHHHNRLINIRNVWIIFFLFFYGLYVL